MSVCQGEQTCCVPASSRRTVQAILGGSPMRELSKRLVIPLFIIFTCIIPLSIPWKALAADEEPLNKEQIKQFLQTADIIKSKQSGKAATHPWRLTLSNGTTTH